MSFREQWDVSFNQMASQSDSLGYLPPHRLCISDDDDDNESNIAKGTMTQGIEFFDSVIEQLQFKAEASMSFEINFEKSI